MFFRKIYEWLDSNSGLQVSESTRLPTEQSFPKNEQYFF